MFVSCLVLRVFLPSSSLAVNSPSSSSSSADEEDSSEHSSSVPDSCISNDSVNTNKHLWIHYTKNVVTEINLF